MNIGAWISCFSNLKILNLSNNSLRDLPQQISDLHPLGMLELADNMISVLPFAMFRMTSLYSLKLTNNPLQSPPPELIDAPFQTLLDYLRQIFEAKDTSILNLSGRN